MKKVFLVVSFFIVIAGLVTAQAQPPAGMVFIKGGTFTMGSPVKEASRDSDEAQHQVTVSSFYMSATEVTQADYEAVMGSNPSSFKGPDLPVENIKWYDAVAYCNARSVKEGRTPAYTINGTDVTWNWGANGYRLPTEAEWEYACRAGTIIPFYTGQNITTSQANYHGGYSYNGYGKGEYRETTVPVGSFSPNEWGLYDMSGNVSEWCWDWHENYTTENQTDPMGPASGAFRVLRGGNWASPAVRLRSAARYREFPSNRSSAQGIRVVRGE